jgi:HEAT repeat protein
MSTRFLFFLGCFFLVTVAGSVEKGVRSQNPHELRWKRITEEIEAGRGADVMDELLKLLDNPVADERESAAVTLGRMGPVASAAVPLLVKHATDADFGPSLRCIAALGEIGPGAASSVSVLTDVLKNNPTWQIRNMAAWSLGRVGPLAVMAVPTLMAALDDPESQVQETAAWALAGLGPAAKEAQPLLEKKVKGWFSHPDLVAFCHVALARITNTLPPHIEAIVDLMGKDGQKATESMMQALVELAPDSPQTLDVLTRALFNPLCRSHRDAVEELERLGAKAVPALERARQIDPESGVRHRAIDALEKIQGSAVDVRKMREESWHMQQAQWDKDYEPMNRKLQPITSKLPPVIRVELCSFEPRQLSRNEVVVPPGAETFRMPSGEIRLIKKRVVLSGTEAEAVAAEWRALKFGIQYQALCHGPVYGLKFIGTKSLFFYSWEKVLFQTTVCWHCSNFTIPRGYGGFDGRDPSILKLKTHLEAILPLIP